MVERMMNTRIYVSGERMASLLEGRDKTKIMSETGLTCWRLKTLTKPGPHGMRGLLVTRFSDALGLSTFMFLEKVEMDAEWVERVMA